MMTLRFPGIAPAAMLSLIGYLALLLAAFAQTSALHAQQTVFSGPQVGEKLPPLPVKGLMGSETGKEFDVIEHVGKKPTLLIFFHSLTRPAFGMTRSIVNFAQSKSEAGLKTAVIFLTDDPTRTESWAEILPKQMPMSPIYGYSVDGIEGPGAYGLNRNVILTILVANEQNVVTFNSALIQPQLQADGPDVLKAIVDVTGGGKVPSVEELPDSRMQMAAARPTQPNEDPSLAELRDLLRKVINKQATADEVQKAAAQVEEFVTKHAAAQKELGRIANTLAKSDKLGNYGTPAAQETIRKWAEKYPAPASENAPPSQP